MSEIHKYLEKYRGKSIDEVIILEAELHAQKLADIKEKEIARQKALDDILKQKYYKLNYENYCKELDKIDQETKETINKCKIKTIIYGGHYAFGYFSKRYGLNHESPYENFSPNSEPTPKNIKEMVELTKKLKVK